MIVFDVNETLLDLSGLDQPFTNLFGERAGEVKRLWFARLLHTSTVMTMVDTWQDFGEVGKTVLTDLGQRLGLEVSSEEVETIVGTMRSLDPYDDVIPGLTTLSDSGAPLVALTNSGQNTAEAQLTHAGIADFFDHILSVEGVRSFKPDPAVYAYCSDTLETNPDQLTLVAAHDWDCAGALHAGWRAAFIERPGQAYNPVLPGPTYQSDDLVSLARTIIADQSV